MTELDSESIVERLGYDPNSAKLRTGHRACIANLIETLVRLRQETNLSQTEVAERMGITQPRVSDFERMAGDPKISMILRYAEAVGANVTFTVFGPEEEFDIGFKQLTKGAASTG